MNKRLVALAMISASCLLGAGCSDSSSSSFVQSKTDERVYGEPINPYLQRGSSENIPTTYPSYSDSSSDEEANSIEDGSHQVEACRDGSCYSLDAEIEDGVVTRINFPNGGYRDIDAEIDENGEGSGTDNDGNNWEVTVDE